MEKAIKILAAITGVLAATAEVLIQANKYLELNGGIIDSTVSKLSSSEDEHAK